MVWTHVHPPGRNPRQWLRPAALSSTSVTTIIDDFERQLTDIPSTRSATLGCSVVDVELGGKACLLKLSVLDAKGTGAGRLAASAITSSGIDDVKAGMSSFFGMSLMGGSAGGSSGGSPSSTARSLPFPRGWSGLGSP